MQSELVRLLRYQHLDHVDVGGAAQHMQVRQVAAGVVLQRRIVGQVSQHMRLQGGAGAAERRRAVREAGDRLIAEHTGAAVDAVAGALDEMLD